MLTKTKIYITVFALVTFVSYWCLYGKTDLLGEIVKNMRFIAMACSIFFSGLILYVKNSLKDLGKLDKLRSKELVTISNFTNECHKRIWGQIVFYAFVFVYALIMAVWVFESPVYQALNVSIFLGLLIVEFLTLIATFKLDQEINQFNSFIQVRAKKVEEKEAALELLKADDNFSEKDLEHFKKRRKTHS